MGDYQFLGEGNTAKIYRLEDKIVKVYNEHLPEFEASYEARKQQIAYDCGLFVPKPLEVTKINNRQALVMEYIEGKTLGELIFERLEEAEYYINLSVDLQLEIHKHQVDKLELMSTKLKRQIEAVNILEESIKIKLIKKLESIHYEPKLCHGDFHLFNCVMNNQNKGCVIDWIDASAGDVRADVYRTYLLYAQNYQELANLYLDSYCKKSGLEQEEIIQWAPIIAGARIAENVTSENINRLLMIVKENI
ncbi:MAG TPA: aminoglycoside phosphotransferase family protein [Niallia sp.]|nr:aminoglycoside phosphotransferase family protein [Niallia sp.]